MKNFSGITDNLDITTKKYVDDGLAGKANLAGNNTFTGGQTITGSNGGYSINASGYVKGSWLQSSVMQNYGSNTGKVCVFDNSGWIYYRTPAEILAEAGGGASTEVVQTTGTSTTSVMSQKATTDELAKKANLNGGNDFTGGGQDFILPNDATFFISDAGDTTLVSVNKDGFQIDDEGTGTIPILLHRNAGTSGQVLTSQGAGKTPIWSERVTLDTGQDITGNKTFTTPQSGGPKIGIYNGRLSVRSSSTSEGGIVWDTPSDDIAADFTVDGNGAHLSLGVDAAADIRLNGNAGIAGQVLTSQGENMTPIWQDVTKHGYTELTNEDLNTILTPGWYRAARNHSCKNIPISSPNEFILIVESSSPNYIQQTFYNIGILSQYYIRYTNNGGTSWSGAGWYTYQLVGTAAQTFSGRKTFSNGINLNNSLQVGGSSGTTGQFLMSQGGSTPKWSSIQVKVNGTVYTIDSNGLIDLGTIGGTTTHTSMGNDIY